MKTITKIMGARIFLKLLVPEDVANLYLAWMQDQEVLRHTNTKAKAYTVEQLKDYVATKYASPNDFLLGIFLIDDNKHIGNIKIGNVNLADKSGDIGIIIGDKSIWGQGYATEAIALATDYAFSNLGINKIIAGMTKENIGSYKAFRKTKYQDVDKVIKDSLCDGKYAQTLLVERRKESNNGR